MRLAVVVPYVARVHGNRYAFTLARALALEHSVTVYVHTMLASLEEELRRSLWPAQLRVIKLSRSVRFSMGHLVWLQMMRGRDRTLSRVLERDHSQTAFDALIVVANEGHWIGDYVRRWRTPKRPVTCLTVLDHVDQIFLLSHARPHALVRRLAMPTYPLLHAIQAMRLRAFDRVVAISAWSAELTTFLYGRLPDATIALGDTNLFRPLPREPTLPPYVAVPTVSLDGRTRPVVGELARRGIPLVTFGPSGVEGIPHRGFVTDAEMVGLLSGAHVTLFLFDYEALGMVPLESLACGTPVVTEPKEGPLGELNHHPFVRFGSTVDELESDLRWWLAQARAPQVIDACRGSVSQYAPALAAQRLCSCLREARARPGSGPRRGFGGSVEAASHPGESPAVRGA